MSSVSSVSAGCSSAGALVLVVGPSGAGKDTLMDGARAQLAGDERFHFARRLITRPAMAGAEDHDSCDEGMFEAVRERGELALSWRAHGLSYGIPVREIASVARGCVVVANISRSAIDAAQQLGGRIVVLNITAPPAVLAGRLAARGRESEADIAARLTREANLTVNGAEMVHIQNDRSVAEGTAQVMAVLRGLVQRTLA